MRCWKWMVAVCCKIILHRVHTAKQHHPLPPLPPSVTPSISRCHSAARKYACRRQGDVNHALTFSPFFRGSDARETNLQDERSLRPCLAGIWICRSDGQEENIVLRHKPQEGDYLLSMIGIIIYHHSRVLPQGSVSRLENKIRGES